MRRLLPVLCLAALVVGGCSSFGVRNQDAATVNGVGIPTDRLTEMVQAQLGQQQQQQQQGQAQGQDIEGITRQALEGLIQFELVLAGARKEGVNIQEGDVDARIEQLKAQVAAQGQKYEDVLRERNISETVIRDQQRVQLAVDLVIVNERAASYLQDLQTFLETTVRRSQSAPTPDGSGPRGSVFIVRADRMTAAQRPTATSGVGPEGSIYGAPAGSGSQVHLRIAVRLATWSTG